MSKEYNGFYLGRFQPFCRNHKRVVEQILEENPSLNLVIGFANLTGQATKENFLRGGESEKIIGLATGLPAVPITIGPGDYLEDVLAGALIENVKIVFSGSSTTLAALEWLKTNNPSFSGLTINNLNDTGSGPRATEFRAALQRGDWLKCLRLAQWQVVAYFMLHPEIRQRLKNLPHAGPNQKHPWRTRTELN